MSRPEIEAASIATALRGFPLREPAGWVDTLLALALAVVAPLVALRFRSSWPSRPGRRGRASTSSPPSSRSTPARSCHGPGAGRRARRAARRRCWSRGRRSPRHQPRARPDHARGGNQRTRRLRALLLLVAAFGVVTVTLVAAGRQRAARRPLDRRLALQRARHAARRRDVVWSGSTTRRYDTARRPIRSGVSWYAARSATSPRRRGGDRGRRRVLRAGPQTEKADAQLIEAMHDADRVILSATATESGRPTRAHRFGKGLAYSRRRPGDRARGQGRGRPRAADDIRQAAAHGLPARGGRGELGRRIDTPAGRSAWIDYAGPARTIPT